MKPKQVNTKMPSVIGKRITKAREFRGVTRTELATAIGSYYREVLRWETEDKDPRVAKLKQIADALQIRMDYFGEPDDVDPDIRFYLTEKEMLDTTGMDDLMDDKRTLAKGYISKIEGVFALKTTCHLLMNYVDGDKINLLSTVVKELSEYNRSDSSRPTTRDDMRIYINDMIDAIEDPVLLAKIANLIVEFTNFENINKQIAIVMQFANNPLNQS